MKKILFTVYVIAIAALVPAVIVGYLHSNDSTKTSSETAKDVTNGRDDGSTFRLVKTF